MLQFILIQALFNNFTKVICLYCGAFIYIIVPSAFLRIKLIILL